MAANKEDSVPSAINTEAPPTIDSDIVMTANNKDPPPPANDDAGIEAKNKDSVPSAINTEASDIGMAANNEDLALPTDSTVANNIDAASLTADKDKDKSANNKDIASMEINTDSAPAVDNDTGKTNSSLATDSDKDDAENNSEKKEKNEEEILTLDKIGTNFTKLAQEVWNNNNMNVAY